MRWLIAVFVMGCGANGESGKPDASADATPGDTSIEAGCAATMTTCGSQCVDLRTDTANCGACGHACGFCADSQCGPVMLGGPFVAMSAIAADADTIYMLTYASSGGLYSCPFTGCGGAPKLLTPVANHPYSQGTLIAGGGWVFWIDGAIFTCATSGCNAASTFAPAPSSNIVTDGTSVYWIANGSLVSCPVAGCTTPTTLTTNVSAYTRIGLAKGFIALGNATLTAICATTGCASPTAIDTGNTSWVGAGGHYVASTTQSSSASISVIDFLNVAAGPTTLATTEDMPAYFGGDDTTVFWVDFDIPKNGVLKKCAWTGCASSPTTITSTLDAAPSGPAWALGANAIAWVAGGTLWADAK